MIHIEPEDLWSRDKDSRSRIKYELNYSVHCVQIYASLFGILLSGVTENYATRSLISGS